ncbi:MAG: hypothetical protein AAFY91_11225, partial [Bacteroidota bacterium]
MTNLSLKHHTYCQLVIRAIAVLFCFVVLTCGPFAWAQPNPSPLPPSVELESAGYSNGIVTLRINVAGARITSDGAQYRISNGPWRYDSDLSEAVGISGDDSVVELETGLLGQGSHLLQVYFWNEAGQGIEHIR